MNHLNKTISQFQLMNVQPISSATTSISASECICLKIGTWALPSIFSHHLFDITVFIILNIDDFAHVFGIDRSTGWTWCRWNRNIHEFSIFRHWFWISNVRIIKASRIWWDFFIYTITAKLLVTFIQFVFFGIFRLFEFNHFGIHIEQLFLIDIWTDDFSGRFINGPLFESIIQYTLWHIWSLSCSHSNCYANWIGWNAWPEIHWIWVKCRHHLLVTFDWIRMILHFWLFWVNITGSIWSLDKITTIAFTWWTTK